MKNILGIIFLISLVGTIILLFTSVGNYLLAYVTTGDQLIEAYRKNIYVRFWINLLAFFFGTLVLSFLGFLVFRPKTVEEDGFQVYANSRGAGYGQGPVDEYVTVRVKKDDLSKLRG